MELFNSIPNINCSDKVGCQKTVLVLHYHWIMWVYFLKNHTYLLLRKYIHNETNVTSPPSSPIFTNIETVCNVYIYLQEASCWIIGNLIKYSESVVCLKPKGLITLYVNLTKGSAAAARRGINGLEICLKHLPGLVGWVFWFQFLWIYFYARVHEGAFTALTKSLGGICNRNFLNQSQLCHNYCHTSLS